MSGFQFLSGKGCVWIAATCSCSCTQSGKPFVNLPLWKFMSIAFCLPNIHICQGLGPYITGTWTPSCPVRQVCLLLPSSWVSWLFWRAFICWWNLCWSEQSCSRYWQVLLLSVWNRCLIPSDVFCRQIFFFFGTTGKHLCEREAYGFATFVSLSNHTGTYVKGNLFCIPPGEP